MCAHIAMAWRGMSETALASAREVLQHLSSANMPGDVEDTLSHPPSQVFATTEILGEIDDDGTVFFLTKFDVSSTRRQRTSF